MKKWKLLTAAGFILAAGLMITSCTGGDKNAVARYKDAGIDMMAEGNYADAVESFDKALQNTGMRVTPEAMDINYYKAAALWQGGDFNGAVSVYTSLIEYDDKNPDPYFLRGCLYANERDIEKAVSDYKEAIKRNEADYDLYIAIYEQLYALDFKDEAMTFLNLALEAENKSDVDSDIGRGRIYVYLNQFDAAEKALLKAKEKGDARADLYLAEIAEKQGDKEASMQYLEAYATSDKKTSESLAALGSLLMESKEYGRALETFQEALSFENVKNEKELRKNEIAALEYTGQFTEAYQKARLFVADYPSEADVIRELPFLLTRFEGPYTNEPQDVVEEDENSAN